MLKLNIGFSRKIGEANFSSRGGSVNLEIEVESGLVREPDKLQAKIDYLFDLAKKSVDGQLNGHGHSEPAPTGNSANGTGNGVHNGDGHGNGNGSRQSTGRTATQSQVRAIHAIANRQRIDLTAELRSRFNVERPDDLGISQASELIDSLKATANGNGGRR